MYTHIGMKLQQEHPTDPIILHTKRETKLWRPGNSSCPEGYLQRGHFFVRMNFCSKKY